MIPVTVIVTGKGTVSHKLKGKFGRGNPSRFSGIARPVIAWNITRACNLRCLHCYLNAGAPDPNELSREEAKRLVSQMADMGVPLLILSGGEPLLRRDLFEIAEEARERGIKLALSTNGTLISREVAEEIRRTGFQYVGISIDSPIPEWHDKFRGVKGAFEAAIKGLKNAVDAGVPAGIRFTVTSKNVDEADGIIELAARAGASRVTFYHLSAAGRAKEMDPSWYMSRNQYFGFIDKLIHYSRKFQDELEIETTMAPFDGIAIADKVSSSTRDFQEILEVVRAQGGCGRKIISVYPDGTVYPCQFVDFLSLGNVRDQKLSEIVDPSRPEILYFSETHRFLKGPRCSTCPFKDVCMGGDRVRAYYLGGSLYADDPMCYLDTRRIWGKWFGGSPST